LREAHGSQRVNSRVVRDGKRLKAHSECVVRDGKRLKAHSECVVRDGKRLKAHSECVVRDGNRWKAHSECVVRDGNRQLGTYGQRSAAGTLLLPCLRLRVDPQAGEETGTWQL